MLKSSTHVDQELYKASYHANGELKNLDIKSTQIFNDGILDRNEVMRIILSHHEPDTEILPNGVVDSKLNGSN